MTLLKLMAGFLIGFGYCDAFIHFPVGIAIMFCGLVTLLASLYLEDYQEKELLDNANSR